MVRAAGHVGGALHSQPPGLGPVHHVVLGEEAFHAGGGAVFGTSVAGRLGDFFAGLAAQPGRELFPRLDEREREVRPDGPRWDNRCIAKELLLSDKTVRNHVSAAFKLDVTDRSEAIARAPGRSG